jgi:ankyrin repeat protein
MAGHLDIVIALLESGSYCDIPNKDGSTAMHLAALYGKIDILPILLEKDIDCDVNREVTTDPATLPLLLSFQFSHLANYLYAEQYD